MTRLLTLAHVREIIQKKGILPCFSELTEALRSDYARWDDFQKMPRIANHYEHGVIELMPICDNEYYAYKYVNGHPFNPKQNKLTVVASGMLSEVASGYPVLISEMTILTALRTAATCALASDYLARKNSKTMGIIGTGSQAEFQVLALKAVLDIERVQCFDIDPEAMRKFEKNMESFDLNLQPCKDAKSTVDNADVIVTATADKQRSRILEDDWIRPGMHINGVGGDCPGKTELSLGILKRAKIVVEYFEQSKKEGEIQHLEDGSYTELCELVSGKKLGRESDEEITLFDSVGFALEDYTVLKYFAALAEEMNIGEFIDVIPSIDDPKDLFQLIR